MTAVVLPGKVKTTVEVGLVIRRVDGTIDEERSEHSKKEYISETKEVEE